MKKNQLSYILKIVLSLILVFLLLKKVELESVFLVVREANIIVAVMGFLIVFFCWVINTYKWNLLLKFFGLSKRTIYLLRLNLVSFFYSSIIPGGQLAGESIKCYKICKGEEEKAKLIFSVVMDRITGLVAMIFLGAIGAIASKQNLAELKKIEALFLLLSIISVIFYLLYSSKFFPYIRNKFASGFGKMYLSLSKIIDAFAAYRGAHKTILAVMVYGLVFQLLSTFSIYLFALSLDINIPFLDLLWINGIISIVLIIPVTIMGLGLREVSFVYMLQLLGIADSTALSLSLLLSFAYLLMGAIGGLIELYDYVIKQNNRA